MSLNDFTYSVKVSGTIVFFKGTVKKKRFMYSKSLGERDQPNFKKYIHMHTHPHI